MTPPTTRGTLRRRTLGALAGFGLAIVPGSAALAQDDPLGAAVDRLAAQVESTATAGDEARAIGGAAAPAVAAAARALDANRRELALFRLAEVWADLEASAALATKVDLAALEAEWRAAGAELGPAWDGSARAWFENASTAARAIGEAALAKSGGYYHGSLEYGANTAPEYGRFYLQAARAELELARLAARALPRGDRLPLALRSPAPEIEALEDELLAAYRPPASIESHRRFIAVSAQLKEARELDEAGLRHGALGKLLEARLALARLLRPERALTREAAAARVRETGEALARERADSSLARLYLDLALVAAADPDPEAAGGATAAAVLDEVLPLYLATLGPAPPRPPDAAPEATVTLVRWPYT